MKVYGKVLRTWKQMVTINWNGEEREVERDSQFEIRFMEYDSCGKKVRRGTEDFSVERAENLAYYRVFTWDGKMINKGGNRWFEERLKVRILSKDLKQLKEIAAKWFPTAAEISIRKA